MTQCLPRRETGPKPKPYLLRQSGINIWLLFVFAYLDKLSRWSIGKVCVPQAIRYRTINLVQRKQEQEEE